MCKTAAWTTWQHGVRCGGVGSCAERVVDGGQGAGRTSDATRASCPALQVQVQS